jgi:hypothetical protein
MPVIFVTQEAEIKKVMFLSHPGQIFHKTLSKKKKTFTKKGWQSDSRCRPWVQTPVLKKKKSKLR